MKSVRYLSTAILLFAGIDSHGAEMLRGTCTLTATPANFGSFNPASQLSGDVVAEIILGCPLDTPYTIMIDAGRYSGGNFSSRKLKVADGGDVLLYNYYIDPTYTKIWGDGTGGTSLQSGTIRAGENRRFYAYSRLTGLQNPRGGIYRDQVIVTALIPSSDPKMLRTTISGTVVVQPICQISTTPMNFGVITGKVAVSGSASVNVTCTKGTPFAITLGGGQNPGSRWRRLTDGTHFLDYGLYVDSSASQEWGDPDWERTYPFGTTFKDVGDGTPKQYPIYGRTFPAEAPHPGQYSDTVKVTVLY